MTSTDIENLIKTRLKAITGIPEVVDLNVPFIQDIEQSYVRLKMMDQEPLNGSLGPSGHDHLAGLAQVDIIVPVTTGTTESDALAEAIIVEFNRTSEAGLWVKKCWKEGGVQEPDRYFQPVVMRWQSLIK